MEVAGGLRAEAEHLSLRVLVGSDGERQPDEPIGTITRVERAPIGCVLATESVERFGIGLHASRRYLTDETFPPLGRGGAAGGELYVELKPISERFVAEAVEVSGLDRERLAREGVEPAEAMLAFGEWVRRVAGRGRPVFVAFNATFDWSFVHWYFIHFVGESPFGIAGLDVKAYYMGALGKRRWAETTRRATPRA